MNRYDTWFRSLICVAALSSVAVAGCAADTDDGDEAAQDEGTANDEGATGDEATATADGDESVGTSEAAASAPVPKCVTYVRKNRVAWVDFIVTNRCTSTERVKIDLWLAPDTPCKTIKPRQSATFVVGAKLAGSRFRKVARC